MCNYFFRYIAKNFVMGGKKVKLCGIFGLTNHIIHYL